jgi:hypothetical protein
LPDGYVSEPVVVEDLFIVALGDCSRRGQSDRPVTFGTRDWTATSSCRGSGPRSRKAIRKASRADARRSD